MKEMLRALGDFLFWLGFISIPVVLLISLIVLIRGLVCFVKMLRAEPGSGRRKDLKRSTLRCLISSAVLFGCFLLLDFVIGGLALANM